MKLIIGLFAGFALGGYLFNNMTDEQRAKVSSKASSAADRVKGSKVGETIADNASQVAGAASDRAVDAVDTAGDKATAAVSSDDSPSTTATATTPPA